MMGLPDSKKFDDGYNRFDKYHSVTDGQMDGLSSLRRASVMLMRVKTS